jgi:hypothetical protein
MVTHIPRGEKGISLQRLRIQRDVRLVREPSLCMARLPPSYLSRSRNATAVLICSDQSMYARQHVGSVQDRGGRHSFVESERH